jgi:hypothetical protein
MGSCDDDDDDMVRALAVFDRTATEALQMQPRACHPQPGSPVMAVTRALGLYRRPANPCFDSRWVRKPEGA